MVFSIDESFLEKLGGDFAEVLREDVLFLNKEAATGVKSSLPMVGAMLAWSALTGLGGYLLAKQTHKEHENRIKDSFSTLAGTHTFKSNPGQYQQRFSELSLLSPSIASNPAMADKVIKENLNKGFDLNDVHRLTAVEYYTTKTPKPTASMTAAAHKVLHDFGSSIQGVALPAFASFFGAAKASEETSKAHARQLSDTLRMVKERAKQTAPTGKAPAEAHAFMRDKMSDPEQLKKFMEALASKLKNRATGGEQVKEGSEIKLAVSDECMGRMLADRHCMFLSMCNSLEKTAAMPGFTSTLKSYFTGGGKALDKYLKVMLLPLAIGGGIQLIKGLQKGRENAKMREAADTVFHGLRRNSELVRENPELANEAFDSLKSFAPALAAKPIITRTFVEDVIKKQGLLPPDTINMLTRTEQMIQQVRENTGSQGFIEGLKSPMSLFGHSVAGAFKKKD